MPKARCYCCLYCLCNRCIRTGIPLEIIVGFSLDLILEYEIFHGKFVCVQSTRQSNLLARRRWIDSGCQSSNQFLSIGAICIPTRVLWLCMKRHKEAWRGSARRKEGTWRLAIEDEPLHNNVIHQIALVGAPRTNHDERMHAISIQPRICIFVALSHYSDQAQTIV